MSQEITISVDGALGQAGLTADDYLHRAIKILDERELDYTTQDAIALAHVMALDFNATINSIRLQDIRDSLNLLSSVSISLDQIARAIASHEPQR